VIKIVRFTRVGKATAMENGLNEHIDLSKRPYMLNLQFYHRRTVLRLSGGGERAVTSFPECDEITEFNIFSDKSARIFLVFPSIYTNCYGLPKFWEGQLHPLSYIYELYKTYQAWQLQFILNLHIYRSH
jgi:hypothetical protein